MRRALWVAAESVVMLLLWPVLAVCAVGVHVACALRDRRDDAAGRAEQAWLDDWRGEQS